MSWYSARLGGKGKGRPGKGKGDKEAGWHWKTGLPEGNSDTEEQKALL